MTGVYGVNPVDISQLKPVGQKLKRPECVLCTSDGSIWTSCWPGGVSQVRPDGCQRDIVATNLPFELYPNGIAMLDDGSFLLANLGTEGGVWRLYRSGEAEPFLLELDGVPLPPSNFVMLDREGRVWITVSTRHNPRSQAYRRSVADGFIVRVEQGRAQLMAEGLGFTNEVMFDPAMEWLYVNETFARRLSRFRVNRQGLLYNRQTVAEFGPGDFPDGLAMDEDGGIWVASIISNRLIRLAPDGSRIVVVEDSNPDHLAWVEHAYTRNEMDRPHMDTMRSRCLQSTSSIAFGGETRSTAYLGCLLGEQIQRFAVPVKGNEPVHWNWTKGE